MMLKTLAQVILEKTGKTIWQWIAVIAFFAGVTCNLLGWATGLWLFILGPFILWPISIWCVIAKPVVKEGENENN